MYIYIHVFTYERTDLSRQPLKNNNNKKRRERKKSRQLSTSELSIFIIIIIYIYIFLHNYLPPLVTKSLLYMYIRYITMSDFFFFSTTHFCLPSFSPFSSSFGAGREREVEWDEHEKRPFWNTTQFHSFRHVYSTLMSWQDVYYYTYNTLQKVCLFRNQSFKPSSWKRRLFFSTVLQLCERKGWPSPHSLTPALIALYVLKCKVQFEREKKIGSLGSIVEFCHPPSSTL